MRRFVGYLNRRPYLWFVDLDSRAIEPAAELREIPQGIDELIPVPDAVALRCGPTWLRLDPNLSGKARALEAGEVEIARRRSVQVASFLPSRPEMTVDQPNGAAVTFSHPVVGYWLPFATWSPDRATIAAGGSLAPFRPPSGAHDWKQPYEPSPSVLTLIDVGTGTVRVCNGTFDNFCSPPAWSSAGELIAFAAPFENRRLYKVRAEEGVVEPVAFRRNVPVPLLDAALLPA